MYQHHCTVSEDADVPMYPISIRVIACHGRTRCASSPDLARSAFLFLAFVPEFYRS
jgi:hypothetical protein